MGKNNYILHGSLKFAISQLLLAICTHIDYSRPPKIGKDDTSWSTKVTVDG